MGRSVLSDKAEYWSGTASDPRTDQTFNGRFFSWNETKSTMPVVEIAARLQHRLTNIHPFINGNGRHARLMTDIFLYSRQHRLPQWPQIQLMAQGNEIRDQYIKAMKQADEGDLTELIQFIEDCLEESN